MPKDSTVVLNGEEWPVFSRLDTVMLGTTTRAFGIHRKGLRRIITERFGEAVIFDDAGRILMALTSAVVRDTAFNRDTTRRLYLPLCIGNQYEYHHVKGDLRPGCISAFSLLQK